MILPFENISKYIIIIAIVILVFVTAKKTFSAPDTGDEAGDDVKENELSKSKSWYSQSADSLMEAFIPGFLGEGTDEATVFMIMKQLQNVSDWNMLVYKFGMRTEMPPFPKHSLIEWLKSELTTSEQSELREILNAINVYVI